jgi:hypothetical protein
LVREKAAGRQEAIGNLEFSSTSVSGREGDLLRYPGVTHFQLIANMYHCLSGKTPYDLNYVAVAAHDGNLRFAEMGKLLRVVDVSHDDIRQALPLIEWYYNDRKLTGAAPVSVPTIVVQQRLDELVERRNDVAHRGGNPSNRLGVEEMQALVEFVLALSRSTFILFTSHYLRSHHVDNEDCERMKLVEGPYKKQHVWIVQRPQSPLHINQPAFALSTTLLARWGRVRNLQVDGIDHPRIEPGGPESIGVLLDFPAPENAEVYVLRAEDPSVWSSAAE